MTLSVATLHNKILSRIKGWRRYEPLTEYEERKTPIYVLLSNEGSRRSITLNPLRTNPVPRYELAGSLVSEGSSRPPISSIDGQSSSTTVSSQPSQSSLESVWPDEDFRSPTVLLSLQLEEQQSMHTDEWIGWINSVPALVKYTRIQGIYKSTSTLLLLTMPVALWNFLPSDPAVKFVGFAQSVNLFKTPNKPLKAATSQMTASGSLIHQVSDLNLGRRSRDSSLTLKESNEIDHDLERLQLYNTKVFIDVSFSKFRVNWSKTRLATAKLAAIVLEYCSHGVEIGFSNRNSVFDSRKIMEEVVKVEQMEKIKIFENTAPVNGMTNAELKTYCDLYEKNKQIKGLNLIILTEKNFSFDLHEALRAYSEKLDELKAPLFQVGIHFVHISKFSGENMIFDLPINAKKPQRSVSTSHIPSGLELMTRADVANCGLEWD